MEERSSDRSSAALEERTCGCLHDSLVFGHVHQGIRGLAEVRDMFRVHEMNMRLLGEHAAAVSATMERLIGEFCERPLSGEAVQAGGPGGE